MQRARAKQKEKRLGEGGRREERGLINTDADVNAKRESEKQKKKRRGYVEGGGVGFVKVDADMKCNAQQEPKQEKQKVAGHGGEGVGVHEKTRRA